MQKNIKSGQFELKKGELSFYDSVVALLSFLPQRSQEIVKKRFGLTGGKTETLEKIGASYDITRERVRQIITDSIKKISKNSNSDVFKQAEEKIILEISKMGGIISEERLIERLGFERLREANSVIFFATCSSKIIGIEDKKNIKKSWALSRDVMISIKDIAIVAKEVLTAAAVPLTDTEIVHEIAVKKKDFSKDQILSYLDVLMEISKNKFGRWGFANWMEINPKGTRERIYLVLKEKKKPLHFTAIANLIDEWGIGKRKSHPQTVHNELIKDDRFILIGRGIYALGEWGYAPGAIKDVLEEILKKNRGAMTKEEILVEVDKIRQVKKTTVMINLNNNNIFVRTKEGYALKNK